MILTKDGEMQFIANDGSIVKWHWGRPLNRDEYQFYILRYLPDRGWKTEEEFREVEWQGEYLTQTGWVKFGPFGRLEPLYSIPGYSAMSVSPRGGPLELLKLIDLKETIREALTPR